MGKIKNISDLEIYDYTGTVLDQQNWTETTTTTTTSGGGHVQNGSGHLSSPTTTTRTLSTEMVRMSLRLDNGGEKQISLSDLGFGVRPDHRVSVIYARNRADTNGLAVAAYDHSTQATKIYEFTIRDLTASVGLPLGCLMLVGIPSLAAAVIGGIGGAFGAMGQIAGDEQMVRDFAAHDMPGHQFDKATSPASPSGGLSAAGLSQGLAAPAFVIAVVGVIIWLVRKRRSAKAMQAAITERVRDEIQQLRENEGRSTNAQ